MNARMSWFVAKFPASAGDSACQLCPKSTFAPGCASLASCNARAVTSAAARLTPLGCVDVPLLILGAIRSHATRDWSDGTSGKFHGARHAVSWRMGSMASLLRPDARVARVRGGALLPGGECVHGTGVTAIASWIRFTTGTSSSPRTRMRTSRIPYVDGESI